MTTRQQRKRHDRRRRHSDASVTRRRLIAAGGVTAGATLAMSGVAQAAPITLHVGTAADPGPIAIDCTSATNTDCSLRRAIDVANSNADVGDTILFNSSLSGSTINIDSGTGDLPTITTGLAIQGPGASQLTIDGGGPGKQRIFNIDLTTKYQPVSISGLTATNGYSANDGGAIWNNDADLTISGAVVKNSTSTGSGHQGGGVYTDLGSLTIDSSTVSGNTAYAGGGVGSKYGDVTITNSTVSGNTAYGQGSPDHNEGYGGGVWIYETDLMVDRSTIDDNFARDGGGIYTNGSGSGDIVIENSTIAKNHAVWDDGGGIWANSQGPLTVVGSTVTGNTALTDAGGIEAFRPTDPVIKNSIVSGNTATPPSTDDLQSNTSYPFDTAFSLIGVHTAAYVHTTVLGSNLFSVDPQLGPLANNGGPTLTRLPADSSPVVNKGKSFGLGSDQRGLTRPVEFPGVANSTAAGADGADMGAVELQVTPAPTGPTGQRAAALNKCKKKHKNALRKKRKHDALTKPVKKNLNKKFKKCKRKANQLPV